MVGLAPLGARSIQLPRDRCLSSCLRGRRSLSELPLAATVMPLPDHSAPYPHRTHGHACVTWAQLFDGANGEAESCLGAAVGILGLVVGLRLMSVNSFFGSYVLMVQRMVGDALKWFALVAIVVLAFAASFVATLHATTNAGGEASSGSGAISDGDDCSSTLNELGGSLGSALLLLGEIIVGTVDVTEARSSRCPLPQRVAADRRRNPRLQPQPSAAALMI